MELSDTDGAINTYVHHDEAKTREVMDKLDALLSSII